MKSNLSNRSFFASFLVALLISSASFAQDFDIKKYKTIYKFNTVKQLDNSRLLEVSLIVQNKKNRKDKIPIFEADIHFFNVLNDEETLLGIAKTSEKGIAQFIVPSTQKYLLDDEGYINLVARFEETDGLSGKEKDIAVKDVNLELDLVEIDSVKTVLVKAFTIDSLNIKTPLEDTDIVISVKGMLSSMPIEEGTIENGEFEFEFPTNIQGDANGEVTVVSFIDDNDDFGTIIQEKSAIWGVHKIDKIVVEKNTLWSEAAPLWMYIVLTILLVGVWANYIYSIIMLWKIKKTSSIIS